MLNKLSKIVFLYKDDIVFIFVVTTFGVVLQVMCKEYLRNHDQIDSVPQVEAPKTKPKNKGKRNPVTWLSNRGGDIVSITGLKAIINIKPILILIAKKGGKTAFVGAIAGRFGPKILASKALSTSIYKALPYSFSDAEKKRSIVIDIAKDKIIDEKWTYLFEFLSSPTIEYDTKVKKANEMLQQNLDLSTKLGKIRFIFIILFILFGLRRLGPENNGFIALMESLLEALRSGKLSKKLARLIIRRLRRRNIPIDSEFIDLASS